MQAVQMPNLHARCQTLCSYVHIRQIISPIQSELCFKTQHSSPGFFRIDWRAIR